MPVNQISEYMDYHLHTKRCKHAEGEMIEFIEAAIERGIAWLGFADHAPTQDCFDLAHRMTWNEFENYAAEVDLLRDRFPEIRILLGVEADIYPGFEDSLSSLKQNFPIDYTIGSVHYVQNQLLFHMNHNLSISNRDLFCLKEYCNLLHMGIMSGLIDIIGHLDLIKYIFPENSMTVYSALSALLPIMAEREIAVEFNTSGYRKKLQRPFPDPLIVKHLAASKILMCLGSDAHRVHEVGLYFKESLQLLKDAGYRAFLTHPDQRLMFSAE